jgi:biofilm PGA synthesis lipoprotein PgaB
MKRFFLKCFYIISILVIFILAIINDGLKTTQGYHYSGKVAVLEYHNIDPIASDYTITPETFKLHLEALKANHYNVISMQDFIAFQEGQYSVPPDAVVITFDDGYDSFYRYAYPILKEQGMFATNFIIVKYLNTNPGIPFLNWDQIQQMALDGFSFFSHTYNTHDFVNNAKGKSIDPLTNPIYLKEKDRTENEKEYETRILADLKKADQMIEFKLGSQPKLLCFPHGRYTKKLIQLGQQVGIQYFFSGIDDLNTPGNKLIKRINAGSANVTSEKLLHKLKDETTVIGKLKITFKNFIMKTTT